MNFMATAAVVGKYDSPATQSRTRWSMGQSAFLAGATFRVIRDPNLSQLCLWTEVR
jgi:hypothetical protein